MINIFVLVTILGHLPVILYAQLKTEYAELSPQHKPLREEVIRLRQVQNAVDTALRRREQPQEVQRKKHEMEL